MIEATMFVTAAVANVWTEMKPGGNDPVSQYTRPGDCDPQETLTVEVEVVR